NGRPKTLSSSAASSSSSRRHLLHFSSLVSPPPPPLTRSVPPPSSFFFRLCCRSLSPRELYRSSKQPQPDIYLYISEEDADFTCSRWREIRED
ncbi:hypothetical protein SDJN02_24937, partial [Cucurbita argyrosperma subsp. argyrosperma]